MNGLDADGAVPQALESALLLRRGVAALEAESLGTRPTEGTSAIAESRTAVLEETETNTGRRHGVYLQPGTVCRKRKRSGGKRAGNEICQEMSTLSGTLGEDGQAEQVAQPHL